MKPRSPTAGPGAIELVEETVHLLRRAPAGVIALYAVGTLPFVLAFLYFWAEMSRGAFARDYVAGESLGLALAFLWMKCWQAAFAAELRAQITGSPPTLWTLKRVARLALTQTALQPIGLFILPLSSLLVLPFGWAYGFFQNVTVMADGTLTLAEASKRASAQTSLRPEQSYLALTILSVFALFVWINIAIFLVMLPGLLKTILGFDNAYTRAGFHNILNTTYLACTVAIAYICVDPIAKALYALRCFYGQSLQSGEDIMAELRRVRSGAVLTALMLACLAGSVSGAPAQDSISPSQLNQAIDEVQKEPQFAWRMPRDKQDTPDDRQGNWVVRTLRAGAQAILDGLKWVGHNLWEGLSWIWRQLEKMFPETKTPSSEDGSGFGWAPFLQAVLLILIVALASFLAVVIIRGVRLRPTRTVVLAEVVQARPDLNDENVSADQFSEDGWMTMGRDLIAQGNLRLGLRAFYLAGLAHLAAREFISIAIFKSNREYETELRRRARASSGTLGAFSDNVVIFDRVWYGPHIVTTEILQQFEANLQQIRAC